MLFSFFISNHWISTNIFCLLYSIYYLKTLKQIGRLSTMKMPSLIKNETITSILHIIIHIERITNQCGFTLFSFCLRLCGLVFITIIHLSIVFFMYNFFYFVRLHIGLHNVHKFYLK